MFKILYAAETRLGMETMDTILETGIKMGLSLKFEQHKPGQPGDVLVFGDYQPENVQGETFYTISFEQIATLPNAITLLRAALNFYTHQIDRFKPCAGFVEPTACYDGKLQRRLTGQIQPTFDILLAHHALNHGARDHSLQFLVKHFLGVSEYVNEYEQQYVNALHTHFISELALNEHAERAYRFEVAVAQLLYKVESYGINLDKTYINKYLGELETESNNLLDSIKKHVGNPDFNPNSPKQLLEYFETQKIVLKDTSKETLEMLWPQKTGQIKLFIKAILALRKANKISSTYLIPWLKAAEYTNRVHPTFNIHGTTTGRLSSKNPNAQNMPRNKLVRSMAHAPEGMSFISCDLAQAELRVMAVLSQDIWSMNALQADQGDYFTHHLMPAAFPSLLEQYGSMEAYQKGDSVGFKESRTLTKGVQYGLMFGRQPPAIARALNITVSSAKAITTNYFNTATGVAKWRATVMSSALSVKKQSFLTNHFGRQFQLENPRRSDAASIERAALSFLPQSNSSDLCLATAIRIQPRLEQSGCHIFNIIHDDIMLEAPTPIAHKVGAWVALQLQETGRKVFGDQVPFLANFSVGRSWGELT